MLAAGGVVVAQRQGMGISTGRRSVVGLCMSSLLLTAVATAVETTQSTLRVRAASPSSYPTVILADQPLLYYRLDEAQGTTVADSSGNGQNGAYASGVTFGGAGAVVGDTDTAVSSTGAVLTQGGGTLPAGNAARTFELWVKAGSTPNANLMVNSDFGFWVGGSNLNIDLPTGGSTGVGMPYPLTDNKWHLLDFTYDGTRMVLYEDGQSFRTLTFAGPYQTVPSSGLSVGGLPAGYDEVAVFGTALSPARVNAHWTRGGNSVMACAPPVTGALEQSIVSSHPAAFLTLKDLNQDGTDRVAFDSSGNCLNGSFAPGSVANATDQPIGDTGGSVTTTQGGGTIRQSGTQLPAGNAARSLGLWIKSSASPNANVLVEGDFGFWVGGANINPILPGGGSVGIGMPFPLGDSRWHQVYEVYDGTNLTLYEDGVVFDVLTVSGAYSTTPANGLMIGDYPGAYTDVAVYGAALSSSAVNAQWSRGGSRQSPCLGSSSAYGQAVLGDGPKAFLPLKDLVKDSSDRVAFDASGNCLNGVYDTAATGDSADTPPGDTGGSVLLNGGVTREPGTLLPTGNAARTYEVWIKSSAFPNSNVLIDGDFGYWIGGANLNIIFPSGGSVGIGMPHPLNDNVWHLIDYAYDGTSIVLYEDGNAFLSTAAGGAYHTSATASLNIGPFPGAWADVAVYPTALPPSRISAHFSAGQAAGPVGGPYTANQSAGGQNLCVACALRSTLNGESGDPINTATGNLTENVVDLTISGRGRPLRFVRTYNSQFAGTTGPLGYGWTFNAGASLAQDASGNVTISQENGSQVTFTRSGSTFTPSALRFIATLTQKPDGTFVFTRQARVITTFSATGQLLSESDLNGYTTTFGYSAGQLATITQAYDLTATPVTRQLTLSYDSNNRLAKVTDSFGRNVQYFYNDGAGNLTDVFDVNGGHWIYTYYPNHQLERIQDPNGNTTTNQYDPTSGRVTEQSQDQLSRPTLFSYSGDPMSATGGTTTITDPKGNVTVETYQYGLRVQLTKAPGTAQAATWRFTYDPGSLGVTTVTDPNGNVTATAYDPNGNAIRVTDPVGRVTVNTYDSLNDLLATTDPNGHTTTMVYDTAGNIRSVSRPYLEGSQTHLTSYSYGDAASHPGDMTTRTDPDGKAWQYTYDSYGDLATMTDPPTPSNPQGDRVTYCYNALSWKTAMYSPRAGTPTCGTASPYETTYDYTDLRTGQLNGFGNVGTITDPNGHKLTQTYDSDQNIVSRVDGDQHAATTYAYDAANEQTDMFPPDGSHDQTVYNADGTVSDDKVFDAHGSLVSHVAYGYDALGRRTSETVAPETASLDRTTTYGYDLAGNLTTVTYPNDTSPDVTYGYDAADERTSITYSDGHTPNVTNIAYDGVGHRVGMTDAAGLVSAWTYDSLDRLVETDTTPAGGTTRTVVYGYDLRGDLTGVTYPSDPSLGSLSVTRSYDDAGRLVSVSDSRGHSSSFTPDADSNVLSSRSSNGTTAAMTYDNADQLSQIADSGPSGSLAGFTYARDGNNQVLSVTTTGLSDSNGYGYSTVNQLGQVNGRAYQYDAAGNPTVLHGTQVQTVDPANELQGSANVTLVATGENEAAATGSGPLPVTFQDAGGGAFTASANDQILVAITIPGSDAVTTPAGYTKLADLATGTGAAAAQTITFIKKAQGGEGSVTITPQGSLPFEKTAVAAVYRGADPSGTDAVDATASAIHGSSPTISVGPVNASVPGDRLAFVEGAAGNATAASWSTPSSPIAMTDEVHESGMALSATALADATLPAAGSVGPEVGTFGTGANLTGLLVTLRPATTSYGFDARGNRTSMTPPGGTPVPMGYDGANRLVSYGSAATYAYRGDGLRMSKTVGTATQLFTWSEADATPLLLDDGTAYYVYGPGNRPIWQITPQPSISLVGSGAGGSAPTAGPGPVTLQLPGGIQANDEILLGVTFAQGADDSVKSVPAGFAQVASSPVKSASNGNPNVLAVYAKRADGSESGQTLSVTLNTPTATGLVATVYRGVDPNHPIDVTSPGTASGQTQVTPNPVTTGYTNDRWVVFQGATYVSTATEPWAPPQGMTEVARADAHATVSGGVADAAAGAPGTVQSLTSQLPVMGQLTALLVALKTPPQVTWYASDQLGTTRLLTDEGGAVVGSYTADAYGNPVSSSGTSSTPLLYAGQYRDAESGFYYLRARYYDPSTAQFISRDPLASLTKTPYAYTNDNPLNETDPTGLCGWTDPFGCISDAAGAVANQATSWAGDIKDAGTQAKNWVADHHEGILTGVGIAAGVVSAATGVGALVDAEVLGGEAVLSATSVGAGLVAGGLDGPGCLQGDKVACVGMGLGLAGGFSGAPDLLGGLFGVAEDTLPYAILKGVSAFGLNLGFAGTGIDLMRLFLSGSAECQ